VRAAARRRKRSDPLRTLSDERARPCARAPPARRRPARSAHVTGRANADTDRGRGLNTPRCPPAFATASPRSPHSPPPQASPLRAH
jgi:hypothetical protein